jgi:hypothetical protein
MRLTNIQVDEVSLVDKAANKRKFAFLKRDDTDDKVKTEVIEAQKVIDKEEFTPEELEVLRKIHTELTELAAQVKNK